jgi:hypothetical protein
MDCCHFSVRSCRQQVTRSMRGRHISGCCLKQGAKLHARHPLQSPTHDVSASNATASTEGAAAGPVCSCVACNSAASRQPLHRQPCRAHRLVQPGCTTHMAMPMQGMQHISRRTQHAAPEPAR